MKSCIRLGFRGARDRRAGVSKKNQENIIMNKNLKIGAFSILFGVLPLAAQADMTSIPYSELAGISGQALTLDIGKTKDKGLSLSMDNTGGFFSVGPTKTKFRTLGYSNPVTGAAFSFDGGKAKSKGFGFSWTMPTTP
jgi:hypothetical protein